MVRFRNRTLDHYQSLGIGLSVGPQPLFSASAGEREMLLRRKLHGENEIRSVVNHTYPPLSTFYDGECQIGSLQLEVIGADIQMNDANRDFLATYGEGISHICFNVPDPEGETDKLVKKGCEVIFSVGLGGRIGENYIHHDDFGNIWISFRPPVSDWEKAWKANNMSYPVVKDWRFHSVGVAVHDLDRTVDSYQSMKIGTPQPEALFDSDALTDFRLDGKICDAAVRQRMRTVRVGPTAYEFIQPLEGGGLYRDFLERKGEGINDIAFTVDDLEGETVRLAERGVQPVLSGKPDTGSAFAYFDIRKSGGIMLKLIQGGEPSHPAPDI